MLRQQKKCLQCKKKFTKPVTCSKKDWPNRKYCSKECAYAGMIGHKPWNAGKILTEVREENAKRRRYRKCVVCGKDTRHTLHKTKRKLVPVRCDNPKCIETVRLRKNERIRKTHLRDYKTGKRKSASTWTRSRVSEEEIIMHDWFIAQGWKAQFHINTGVRPTGKRVPLVYDLDFALVKKKLYVEIDGSVHRNKTTTDERRNRVLLDLGWKGLRIPATMIKSKRKRQPVQIDEVKQMIREFVKR